jgi:heme/copper-type cytochrome/quinol oxidase subunit 4
MTKLRNKGEKMDPVLEPWYKTKAFWLSVVLTIMAISTLLANMVEQNPVITATGWLMFIGAVGQAVIRIWFTNTVVSTPQAKAKLASAKLIITKPGKEQ